MTDETIPPGLWEETRRAAEAWEKAREARRDQPATPGPGPDPVMVGQVLILQELREPRLAWAVIRREAGENPRLLLIPADVNPLVGFGDVAVSGSAVGSLTLRCRLAVWASDRELGAATPLGSLPPETLSTAESRLQALAAGKPVGTFTEHETEEDPEYQDWIEDVVRPAVDKLTARADTEASSTLPVLSFPTRRPLEPTSFPRGAWMRWAAVLAFVGLGAASGVLWWWQTQKIAGLRAAIDASEGAHRQAITELEARRAALESLYQARLQEAGQDRARLEAEHRARLQEVESELAKLRQATAVKNLMFAALEPSAIQRGPKPLAIGPHVSHLVLLLRVDDPAGAEFEIEVSERRSDKQIFAQKGLRANDLDEVSLGLPAVLVPPGAYRLRLFRKEGGKLHLVREHMIQIVEEGSR